MPVFLGDSFSESLARLTNQEQRIIKTASMDFLIQGPKPGAHFHRIERTRDPHFWSFRVNADLRIIVHQKGDSQLLCHVDHHEKAYDWARKRRIEAHPTTGALQIVEIREVVEETFSKSSEKAPKKTGPFSHLSSQRLLEQGVPPDWIATVQNASEDSWFDLAKHMPAEAMEALLQWASGNEPARPASTIGQPEQDHPDTQRRFRLIGNAQQLQQALEYPWDRWAIFLHPEQRKLVETEFPRPARVCGSAGTGKTIVALHRAFSLAQKHSNQRVLLTTFSEPLARSLKAKLKILAETEPQALERIDVRALDNLGKDLYRARIGPETPLGLEEVHQLIRAEYEIGPRPAFPLPFLFTEWDHIVDAWQFARFEDYEKFTRVGTRRRLTSPQRKVLWDFFDRVKTALTNRKGITQAAMFTRLAQTINPESSPYRYLIVDEAQDLSVAQLRFLAQLGGNQANGLFFAGDGGQQIFQRPFPWKDVGLDMRGRSRILKINYRTSHEIRAQADQLLDGEIANPDGELENRKDVISVFTGPAPEIHEWKSEKEEVEKAAAWIKDRIAGGVQPEEIGVIVRSPAQRERALRVAKETGLPVLDLDQGMMERSGCLRIATMHLAKGLEFRAVLVMACDEAVIPSLERIEEQGDGADLDLILEKERHLLYVACTRARDHLWVSGVKPVSEFLGDLFGKRKQRKGG